MPDKPAHEANGGDDRSDWSGLTPHLAHELRNIVGPIRNAVHVIRLRAESDATIQSMADIIERQITAMADLLETARGQRSTSESAGTPATARQHDTFTNATADRERPDHSLQPSAVPRRRILVADDSAAVRESITALLCDLGHDVKTAADAKEALALAEQWKPEFVLLDIHMPGPNGLVVARRLRARFSASEMTLVMMSGIALDDVTRSAAIEAGFDHCLDKAFTLASLQQLLDRNVRADIQPDPSHEHDPNPY